MPFTYFHSFSFLVDCSPMTTAEPYWNGTFADKAWAAASKAMPARTMSGRLGNPRSTTTFILYGSRDETRAHELP